MRVRDGGRRLGDRARDAFGRQPFGVADGGGRAQQRIRTGHQGVGGPLHAGVAHGRVPVRLPLALRALKAARDAAAEG